MEKSIAMYNNRPSTRQGGGAPAAAPDQDGSIDVAAARTFRVHELGCKVNQWEGQWLREGLEALGLEEAAADGPADLFLVNSCSVTESGGSKSRHSVRHFMRRNPAARVIVTGCYAESDRDEVAALPGVVRAFGNQEKGEIVPWVARALLGMDGELPELPRGISRFAGHTRAFVKIQDGCRDHCAFCIIPSLRSRIESRPVDEIVAEVETLVARGHKEVVLTGVHLGYFGWDRDEPRAIKDLLGRLAGLPGLQRLKLSSIEVHEIDEELVDLFAGHPVFVPHFHLPLQAGSDATLRRMRRRYNLARFREAVALLRARLDDPALTTDLIVGFPGETAADFDESMAFCAEMAFAKMHVFPYSVRRGTAAEAMPGHLPAAEIARRKKIAAELDDRMAEAYRRRHLGRIVPVLAEERAGLVPGTLTGLSDRFLRVDFPAGDELMNRIVRLRLEALDGDRLRGRLVDEVEVAGA
ncbi:MAG: tRNA (N(6)-L-threonylcarbamoyladenosine(37)-C(2))-methylthiotransferase MtaB [Planctomycetes bacterium]|nr:tRNA (N(6)-L-threonylcarbamoyladenosine(37)-C(2))-methylthiotransferase MtaB [Planctomycetota bacterium]